MKNDVIQNEGTPSQTRLTRTGILMGCMFPAIAIAADLRYRGLGFSYASLEQIYFDGPLHWIILSAPLVLGSVFAYFEKVVRKREQTLQHQKAAVNNEMNQLQSFIEDVARGDFSDKPYEFENKELAALLVSIKSQLIAQQEEEKRARWIAEGHAKFGELFRQTNDLDALAFDVVKNLIQYTGLNQGAVYIHERHEQNGDLLIQRACYAYNRKKYETRSFAPGEGLAGQCFLENETMILKKVPQNYIRITSGLGDAVPGFIMIVPVKTSDHTVGVIELAGFKPIADHQIKFIEKVCEGFASVLRSAKMNTETKALLDATQSQTEQLRAQEEEIRQNLEEMQATQEQLTRQLEESKLLSERVGRREMVMALTTILSETDLHGTILFANDKFCEVSKYSREELIGKSQNIVRHPDMPRELFKLFWKTIQSGEVFKGIVKNKAKDGTAYWVDATIVPIKNNAGEVIKYVGSRYHIQDDALGLTLYNKQAEKFGWPIL